MASESITEIFGPYPAIPAARACAEARVFSFLGRLSRMVIHVPLGSDVTAWAVDVVGCLWLDDWDDGGLVMCVGAGGAAVGAGLLDALSVADGAGAMAIQGFGPPDAGGHHDRSGDQQDGCDTHDDQRELLGALGARAVLHTDGLGYVVGGGTGGLVGRVLSAILRRTVG